MSHEDVAPEASPSAGARETAALMHAEYGLGEYIDENKEDLEALAEEDYPISPAMKAILTRRERGEV